MALNAEVERLLLTDKRRETINLAAGPSSLPLPVLLQATQGLIDYAGTGIGLTELSHRSSTFMSLNSKTRDDLRTLLNVPANFEIIFMQGGGLSQFSITALNMFAYAAVQAKTPSFDCRADYIVSGSWSDKAASEARRLGINVNVVTDGRTLSESKKAFGSLASSDQWNWSSSSTLPAYIYYCANETVNGVEIDPPQVPEHLASVPLVADMSSNILSKPIPWTSHNFGIIYAGAQKNIGPAGLTICFVRKDLLVDVDQAIQYGGPRIPAMMAYKNLADNDSLYNTPPMFCIYVAGLVFEHLLKNGGVEETDKVNQQKAEVLYNAIDESQGFYMSKVDKPLRSRMNVVFVLRGGEAQEKKLIAAADKLGIKQIKGHRSVGGIRVSLYNAITLEATEKVVGLLKQFQKDQEGSQ